MLNLEGNLCVQGVLGWSNTNTIRSVRFSKFKMASPTWWAKIYKTGMNVEKVNLVIFFEILMNEFWIFSS